LFDYQGVKIDSVIADANAAFSFAVNCQTSYKVVGSKQDYTIDTKEFTTSLENDLKLNFDLTLAPSEFVTIRGMLMVNINPIYFDLDKSDIREDAAIELEKVVRIMKKYPLINIDLGRGINPERIKAKGYGESQLVNDCSNDVKCTEAQHQLNRRTEFVIVNPEAIKAQ